MLGLFTLMATVLVITAGHEGQITVAIRVDFCRLDLQQQWEDDVPTGVLKFFKADKGYGFIKPDDGGPDVFVHAVDAERAGLMQLAEGMRLGFEIETDPRKGKTKATRLRLL